MIKKQKDLFFRTNGQIRVSEVRLVGDNVEIGVYSIKDALRKADELELDLIEISPTAVPPVCKIMDYSKYLYDQKKKQKDQEKKDQQKDQKQDQQKQDSSKKDQKKDQQKDSQQQKQDQKDKEQQKEQPQNKPEQSKDQQKQDASKQ